MNNRRKLVIALGAGALIGPFGVFAQPQTYPSKPIRMIAPFAAGGGTDILARAIAQKLTEQLGVSVVVDNRTGAGGSIGADIVAKAPPDGYTILLASTSVIAVNPALYGAKLPFNPERDFAPITLIVKVPLTIATHPSVPARSLKEFIALARKRPDQMTYGSSGVGTSNHLIGAMFTSAARLNMVHVPYKGGVSALIALLSGEVDMAVTQIPAVAPLHRTGKVRVIAISGAKRSSALPGVQTLIEGGLPGLDATSWTGMVAPTGTARSIVDRLNAEIIRAMNVPETRNRLIEDGSEVETSTPEGFANFIRAEIPKWAKAVKDSGAKVD